MTTFVADHALAVWEALMDAGRPHGITPYGTETMHVLRAEKGYIIVGQETDGTVTPDDVGLSGMIAKAKRDFVGKRSLARPDVVASGRKQLVGLVTDDRHGRARPLAECFDRMASWFSSRGLARHGAPIPVITGFIGGTSDGRITTLGRGGSDYSASLIARALDAAELQIWTDVDGIHTCDPRIVPEATRIEHLTFREAGELAYCGAKVLHPQTLAPAMHHGIPVSVRDTRHPDRVGTSITAELPEGSPRERIRAIAHRSGVRVVTVVSPRMLARHGFLSRIAATFDSHGISIDMISTSEVSVSLTPIDPDVHLGAVIRELESFAEVDVIRGKGMVSVVGDRLDEDGTVVAEVLGAITARGVAIDMISYGATHTNLTFLVPQEQVEDAVRALHSRFFVPA